MRVDHHFEGTSCSPPNQAWSRVLSADPLFAELVGSVAGLTGNRRPFGWASSFGDSSDWEGLNWTVVEDWTCSSRSRGFHLWASVVVSSRWESDSVGRWLCSWALVWHSHLFPSDHNWKVYCYSNLNCNLNQIEEFWKRRCLIRIILGNVHLPSHFNSNWLEKS